MKNKSILIGQKFPNQDIADIAKICGADIARKIIKQMGGRQIYVPQKMRTKEDTINRVLYFKAREMSVKQISEILAISGSYVYKILNSFQ